MTTPRETVFVVDDDPSVRKAMQRLLRSAGFNVEIFDDPMRFLQAQIIETPGCLILDMAMPGLNGFEVQQQLLAIGNRLPIIFLTARGDVPMSVRAMKSGAVDFLTKPCGDEQLLKAVESALTSDRVLRKELEDQRSVTERFAALTPREHEVMLGVVAGQSNKQIAVDLGTVERTIKAHRAKVMEKLGIDSIADLVRLSERAGSGINRSK